MREDDLRERFLVKYCEETIKVKRPEISLMKIEQTMLQPTFQTNSEEYRVLLELVAGQEV